MANNNKQKNKITIIIIAIILIIISTLAAKYTTKDGVKKVADNVKDEAMKVVNDNLEIKEDNKDKKKDNKKENKKEKKEDNKKTENKLEIEDNVDLNNDQLHILYFYVGQADATFIKLKDKTMLIDAGNNNDGKNIVKYLKEHNINKIDYVVGTHNHEDHIGGIDEVVEGMDVGKIYMSKIANDVPNYKSVEKEAKKKGLKIENLKKNEELDFGDGKFKVKVALTNKDLNINNSSIVLELYYKNTKYLFTGDAEKEAEKEGDWDKIDVLKVGHHGSGTSSSQYFLDKTQPTYSIIEVGKNNKYRLPNKKTLERLEKTNTKIYRTDTNCSSFHLTSDGDKIDIKEIKVNLDANE